MSMLWSTEHACVDELTSRIRYYISKQNYIYSTNNQAYLDIARGAFYTKMYTSVNVQAHVPDIVPLSVMLIWLLMKFE